MDKEEGREKGGWTDGRGYAWLKGTRWEEADPGVLRACARACACTSYWLIVETSLSLFFPLTFMIPCV